MGDLVGTLRRRVLVARHNLSQARTAGDDYGAEVYAAELEDLLRRAASYRIMIDAADPLPEPGADTSVDSGVGSEVDPLCQTRVRHGTNESF